MRHTCDAIVVSGGHNGVACAATLAEQGLDVTVVERRSVLGGPVCTGVMDGCKYPKASYLISLAELGLLRKLMRSYGLRLLPRDPGSLTPCRDGTALVLYKDTTKTQASIAPFSAKDAETYPVYLATMDRIARFMEKTLPMTPPHPLDPRDWPKLLWLLWLLLSLGWRDLLTLYRLFTESAERFLKRWFESPVLISTLSTDGIIGAVGGPRTRGTAYVLLHHVMGGIPVDPPATYPVLAHVPDETEVDRGAWAYTEGGQEKFMDAMEAWATDHGVRLLKNAEVVDLIVEDDRAVGVRLSDGRELRAKVVISGVDPHRTFTRMFKHARRLLPMRYLRTIERANMGSMTSKVNMILSGELKFRSFEGTMPGTFHIPETAAEIQKAFEDALQGRMSDRLVLEGCSPSLVDPSLVPAGSGKHVLSLLVQYTPYTLAQGEWDDHMKRQLLRNVIAQLAEHTNILEVLTEHTEVLTPLDLEREFGLTGGNLFHGAMSIWQLFFFRPVFGWAKYRTPIKGLYLCGSGTHPGGGITGFPGLNAAREILKDWRR